MDVLPEVIPVVRINCRFICTSVLVAAAARVCSRSSLMISEVSLNCSFLRPPPPPPFIPEKNVDPSKLLVSYLPEDFTDAELSGYLANAAGKQISAVQSVTRSQDGGKALVHFNSTPGRRSTNVHLYRSVLILCSENALNLSYLMFNLKNFK